MGDTTISAQDIREFKFAVNALQRVLDRIKSAEGTAPPQEKPAPKTSPELMRGLASLLEPDDAAPAAPETPMLAPGTRVLLPSGEVTTLTRAFRPEQHHDRQLWLTPVGNYFEDEIRLPPATPTPPTPAGTCGTCGDVHWMWRQDRMVPCTHCPTPCERCRGDRSAYCGQTPCACSCHTGRSPATQPPSLAEAARELLDASGDWHVGTALLESVEGERVHRARVAVRAALAAEEARRRSLRDLLAEVSAVVHGLGEHALSAWLDAHLAALETSR